MMRGGTFFSTLFFCEMMKLWSLLDPQSSKFVLVSCDIHIMVCLHLVHGFGNRFAFSVFLKQKKTFFFQYIYTPEYIFG